MLQTVKYLADNKNITIIYVTHYPEEILPMFDKCVLMKDGAFYQVGQTAAVFTEENIGNFIGHKVAIESHRKHFYVSMDTGSIFAE